MRQDFRATRKNRRRRQFLNSLRSNRRNCSPSPPVFPSCGPSCSKKSQIQSRPPQSHSFPHFTPIKSRNSHSNPLWMSVAMPSMAQPTLGTSRAVAGSLVQNFASSSFSDVKQDFIQRDSKVKSYNVRRG